MSELMNKIREYIIGGQSTISTLSEIQKEEITITSIDKLQIVLNENTLCLIKKIAISKFKSLSIEKRLTLISNIYKTFYKVTVTHSSLITQSKLIMSQS